MSLAKAFDHGFDRTDEQTEAALDSWQMYRALEIQLRAELKLLEDEDQVLFPPGYFLDFPEDYAA
ncbi:MAG: hypothetical protein HY053_07205 [Proteobacteria bacterium]|nr:hypothetical protein [Pseudomonadota bacterium]